VVTLAVAAPFSGAASTASSATAFAAALGSPEAVESLQTLSHEAPREIPSTHRRFVTEGATVYAETAAQVARVDWTLGRFAQAGLELPEVDVWYFADFSGCADPDDVSKQRSGYLILGEDKYTIYMCGVEFTLLHELAHVWDVSTLTEDLRRSFLAERDADAWSGVEWSRAGGEHPADVLAWGPQDGNVRPSRTMPNDNTSLYEAFELATGVRPLR
jgi:hypothetical protein